MNTTPPPMPEALRLADWLQSRAESIEQVKAAALLRTQHERITALEADRAMLREALKNLLDDTQHAEHPDCEDGPCPVREARTALEKTK